MSKDFIEFFTTVLAVGFGVLAAGLILYWVLWPKIESYVLKLNAMNQSRAFAKEFLQLRFAGYERLLLFVNRLEPKQVMLRHHDPRMTMEQFKSLLLQDVENEFQHNLTQQLYVSDIAWSFVVDLKDNTIALFKNVAKGMDKDANVDQFVAMVLKHMKELEDNPYDKVQEILKKELNS